MLNKIFPILSQYISKGDAVILGVSGGPDSTALLNAFVHLAHGVYPPEPWRRRAHSAHFRIIVAHINHGIRGKASDCDEKFVRNLAKSYGLSCFVKRVRLAGKSGVEELGRKVRRAFFEKLRFTFRAKWIITAHTQDDQLETIVFNFLRGSGPAGLAGMKIVEGAYFKPLLGVSKAEILEYLASKKLKFRKDRMNEDTRFSRVFIRKKILPLFHKINPSFSKTALRNAEIFLRVDEWLSVEAGRFLGAQNAFRARDFRNLPAALQTSVLQLVYRRALKNPYRLSSVKISEILRMIGRNIGKKKILLGKKGNFYLDKGLVTVRPD